MNTPSFLHNLKELLEATKEVDDATKGGFIDENGETVTIAKVISANKEGFPFTPEMGVRMSDGTVFGIRVVKQ